MEKSLVLRMATFKRRYGLTQRAVNKLAQEGMVEIQQGGFKGHSTCHSKLIVVRTELASSKARRIKNQEEWHLRQIERRLKRLEEFFIKLSWILPRVAIWVGEQEAKQFRAKIEGFRKAMKGELGGS